MRPESTATWAVLGLTASLLACNADVRLGALVSAVGDGGGDGGDGGLVADGDAGCGDTTSSTSNCGRCGHSCLGQPCVSGVCSSIVLASGLARPDWLALDATNVYFTCNGRAGTPSNENDIATVDLQGNGFQILRKDLTIPAGIVLDASSVYFAAKGVGSQESMIRKIGKLGGSVTPVANASLGDAQGLAIDGTELFWAGNTAVRRAMTTDNTTFGTDWLTGITSAQGVAVSATRLYVTSGGSPNVSVVDRATKGIVNQITLPGTTFDVVVAASDVYVASGVGAYQLDSSGALVGTLDSGFVGGLGIIADAERVYWTTDQGIRARRRDLQGGVETVATFNDVGHLAIDASWVYFTRHLAGEVRKVAR